MARALVAVGVPLGRAYELAKRIEQDLAGRHEESVEFERFEELAVEVLGEVDGSRAVDRLRRLRDLQELDLPVIVLVGGATGTGKSTVATEAAYRLGITRVTSTDFVRQTMRAFFSEEFMPSIHYSSFEAAAGLREPEQADDPAIAGFLEQTRYVLVGVRASIERALEEGWSMMLEGVHLVPGMLPRIDGALVVQCVLAIDDEEEHSTHFMVRDAGLDGLRPHAKYIDRLDDIRRVQDHIVGRARRHGVPVISNTDMRSAIDAVLELVLASAALEGRGAVARGGNGAMSMIAVGERGSLLNLPDMYMRKMAVGPRARGSIDLLKPLGENVQAIADSFGRRPNDITTIVLDRPRHHDLIEDIRASGARIKLIQDGTVTASISAAIRGTNDHLAVGIGGTRQAVMSAAALRCLGGELQAQLWPTSRHEIELARQAGI